MDKKEICKGIRFFLEQACKVLNGKKEYKWIRFNGGFLFTGEEWADILDIIDAHLESRYKIAFLSKETVQSRVANTIIDTFDEWRENPSKNKTFLDYTSELSKRIGLVIENTDEKVLLDRIFSEYDRVNGEDKKKLEKDLVKNFGF